MPWAGSTLCLSFKQQLFEGVHNFLTDTIKLALYGESAALTDAITGYQTVGEVPPLNGYQSGGKTITVYPPTLVGKVALVEFDNVVWPNSDISARGALCYNASKGDASIFVLDFQTTRISNANNFIVTFPGPDPTAAILRIP